MQIVVNCETRLCSQFLGPGDNFLQSYGAIFTDRAATGSGNLMDLRSTDRCSEKNNKEKKIFFLSTGVNNNIPEWPDSIILEVLGYKTYCCPEPTLRS